MLNRAARFFPILRELKSLLPAGGALLEVGSGSLGLGEFWADPFVGCDVTFSSRPVKNMRAVRCSGHQLPFGDRAFDAVVVSDVMEHVPPPQRSGSYRRSATGRTQGGGIRLSVRPGGFSTGSETVSRLPEPNLPRLYGWRSICSIHFPMKICWTELPAGWKRRVIPNESLAVPPLDDENWRCSGLWDYFFRFYC